MRKTQALALIEILECDSFISLEHFPDKVAADPGGLAEIGRPSSISHKWHGGSGYQEASFLHPVVI
jgi:hypothetical protein